MPVQVIPTPCKGVCKIHPDLRVCRGCYRTPLEIKLWPAWSNIKKLEVLAGLKRKELLYGDITT